MKVTINNPKGIPIRYCCACPFCITDNCEEIFFIDTLWPDFSTLEYQTILSEYYKIERNYGL